MSVALNDLVRTVRRSAEADRLAAESDDALLDRLHPTWDAVAFEALVRRHARSVSAACRSVLRDDADVNDAVQATFLVLLRNAGTVRRGSPLGRWLYGVARKVSLKAKARAVAVGKREAKAARGEQQSSADPGWRETCDLLLRELARLPAAVRRPLELCYLDGLTRDEAAAALGVSVGTVKGRLERGRAVLRERLEKRGVALSVGLLVMALMNSAAAVSPRVVSAVLSAASGSAPPTVAALAEGITVSGSNKVLSLLAVFAAGVLGVVGWAASSVSAAPDDKPVMTKPADAGKAKPAKPEKPTAVGGTVVGPDGKPVADATVSVVYGHHDQRAAVAKVATTDADGKFRADVPKEVPAYFTVFATKPGFGVAWVEPKYPARTIADADKLALKLTADQPIRGRVLDTQGKPVAGAIIGVLDVIEPTNGDLDQLLKGSTDGRFGTVGQWEKVLWVPREVAGATTDADGKFEIAGLGADRVVGLTVSGKGLARMSGMVVTRTGVDVAPLNRLPAGSMRKEKGQHAVFYGPTPTFVVEPGYAVQGVVTAAKTGKPVANCRLEVNTGHWDRIHTTTDAAGKYRFDGLTKGMGHYIHATPPDGVDVFPTWADVKEGKGFEAVTHDFALAAGAVFAGRVIDKETKQPVPASFQIIPTADNEFAKKPEYETASRDMVWKGGSRDGVFRIVTVPGKSAVNISVGPTGTLHDQPFHPYRGGQTLEIDLPETGGKEHVIEIDRGKTAAVAAVDESGKPVSGLVVAGITLTNQDGVEQLRAFALPAADSKFTVYGLGEKEKRRVIVIQPEKKLAGSVVVTPDGDLKVTLAALQPLRGTFTDPDGTPLAGVSMSIEYNVNGLWSLFRDHVPTWKLSAVTGKDGNLEILNVIPGLPFTFGAQKGDTNYRGVPRLGTRVVPVGKPLELGVRKLEIAD